MHACRVAFLTGALLAWTAFSGARADHEPVTIHAPGYSYSPFISTSSSGADLELDSAGNLYLCESGNIQRVTPDGAISAWSTATAFDLTFTSTGAAYGAGRATCHCVVSIHPAGLFSTLHADSFEWTNVALGVDGSLYATVWAGTGQGLYTIDRVTGAPTVVVNGGPGVAGSGAYVSGMLVGIDGKLYAGGIYAGGTTGWELFRLDGSQFTPVGSSPRGANALAQDGEGIFYAAASVEGQGGEFLHEVWMLDLSTGSSTLLARGFHGIDGIAFDRARDRLYVWIGSGGVYIISKNVVPTRRATWGAVKRAYR